MSSIVLNKIQLSSKLLAIAAIISTMAIYNPSDLCPSYITRLTLCIEMGCCFGVLLLSDFKWISKNSILFICIPISYFVINLFDYNRIVGIQLGLGIVPPLLCCSFVKSNVIYKSYEYFINYIYIISLLSLLALLDFILNLNILPHKMVPFYMEESKVFYVDYFFSYIYINADSFRLCGLCNEPGFWGTLSSLALVSSNCKFNTWKSRIILIGGILTLSVAFFSIIIIYYVLRSFRKNPLKLIYLFIGAYCIVGLFIYLDNPVTNRFIERFEYDSKNGKFKGDNRGNRDLDEMFDRMFDTSELYFGKGTGFVKYKYPHGVAGAKRMFVDWGLIGFLLTYGILLAVLLYYSRNSYNAMSYVICFAASIYQRADVFTLGYLLLIIGGIVNLNRQKSVHIFNNKSLST